MIDANDEEAAQVREVEHAAAVAWARALGRDPATLPQQLAEKRAAQAQSRLQQDS